jgi:hypothetical protein
MFVEYLIQFAQELSSFDYVSMVLRYKISLRVPTMCREVVDHVGDSCVEFFAVHPPYIDWLVELGLEEDEDYVLDSP